MNQTLLDFERHCGLGPTFAAALLGISYVTYAQYRSGRRPLQLYHARHIEALSLLPKSVMAKLIEEHANGGKHKPRIRNV